MDSAKAEAAKTGLSSLLDCPPHALLSAACPAGEKERMLVNTFPSRAGQASGLCNGSASLLLTEPTSSGQLINSTEASVLPNGSSANSFQIAS